LHLANFLHLHEARLIDSAEIERDVAVLGNKVIELLKSLPDNEFALSVAFQKQELAGKPLVHFAGDLEREKFRSLGEFIRQAPT
jgi:hypothetical protein